MKIGIEVQIDVKKIEKARLYAGAKGTYLTLTAFIDTDVKNEYGDNGFISHKQTKEESDAKVRTPILGNVKVFWTDAQQQQRPQQPQQQQQQDQDDFDDSIPF